MTKLRDLHAPGQGRAGRSKLQPEEVESIQAHEAKCKRLHSTYLGGGSPLNLAAGAVEKPQTGLSGLAGDGVYDARKAERGVWAAHVSAHPTRRDDYEALGRALGVTRSESAAGTIGYTVNQRSKWAVIGTSGGAIVEQDMSDDQVVDWLNSLGAKPFSFLTQPRSREGGAAQSSAPPAAPGISRGKRPPRRRRSIRRAGGD